MVGGQGKGIARTPIYSESCPLLDLTLSPRFTVRSGMTVAVGMSHVTVVTLVWPPGGELPVQVTWKMVP